ncbi:hypothetical protein GCM10018775_32600 [Streptomyces umbrinus]|nr:hypothetical protein GCM10018775_32600 [Streptomyces umbrinus]
MTRGDWPYSDPIRGREVFRPCRPYPFPSLFGGQPPNPRSSNAGGAKYIAARADTFSPSGV